MRVVTVEFDAGGVRTNATNGPAILLMSVVVADANDSYFAMDAFAVLSSFTAMTVRPTVPSTSTAVTATTLCF